jgi:colanic acid/amylovoran biosynthesis glycosyltransferase
MTFIVAKFLRLLASGWDVHVVCGETDSHSLYPELCSSDVLADRVHVTKDLESLVGSLEPGLVHFEFAFLSRPWLRLRDRFSMPILLSHRGEDFFPRAATWYRDIWDQADAFHFISYSLRQLAVSRGFSTSRRYAVIQPGIDIEFFDPQDRIHREYAGSATRPLRVLSVGRIAWKRGYDYALQAVERLRDRGVACEYRIIGAAENREFERGIIFTVEDLALHETVSLLGVQPRSVVKQHMVWADVFLHTAVFEGFSNATLEAQAMTLPVVCTDAVGLTEAVADGESGFVVPRRDVEALADGLRRLAEDPGLRMAMGGAGRKRVRDSFRLDQHVWKFEALYRSLMETGQRETRVSSNRNRCE